MSDALRERCGRAATGSLAKPPARIIPHCPTKAFWIDIGKTVTADG